MTDQDHIDRIEALTRNARNTWFTLLAALVFVSVTLMGVQHIDFYGVDRATKLPLVGVDVPTRYFFVAAPVLIAAIYGYFHLYLIRLWDALGSAPAEVHELRLGDAITPWLISDAALHFRYNHRHDDCTTPRPLEGGAMLLNLLLSWIFGLSVLGALWWLSMPARTWWMTGVAGLSLFVCAYTGAASFAAMVQRLSTDDQNRYTNIFGTTPAMAGLLILVPTIALLSYQRTSGSIERLARLNLYGENIVEKPAGWLPPDIARADFRAVWCKRKGVKDCKTLGDLEAEFENEWKTRRAATLADMRRPDWAKPNNRPRDLRNANLKWAFLSGAHLTRMQMQRAELRGAQMESANFRGAQMKEANLSEAQLQGAKLKNAQMKEANLRGALMKRADLSWALMEGANLSGAQMKGAMLHYVILTGTRDRPSVLYATNLNKALSHGGMLRFVDLGPAIYDAGTDFRNTFLDGSVTMTEGFREQMANDDQTEPCQWVQEIIEDDNVFYGRWRGWVEATPEKIVHPKWKQIAPTGFEDVEAITPTPGCVWKTGPMPGSASE